VIDKTLPLWDQAEVFAHELGHAVIDYEYWVRHQIVEKLKAEVVKEEE
jgi:hypothetical protein